MYDIVSLILDLRSDPDFLDEFYDDFSGDDLPFQLFDESDPDYQKALKEIQKEGKDNE